MQRLAGKEIALIFEKSSTRTRCAFEVAAFDQGAHVTYLDPTGSQMGHKESVADTARVLGRMFDAIEYRGVGAGRTSRSSPRHAGVPGLQRAHQRVAPDADARRLPDDARARATSPTTSIAYAFVGDGRFNMGRSLLVTGAIMGADVRLVAPRDAAPAGGRRRRSRASSPTQPGARITITDDVADGVAGVDFVHTDVWVSMGEPKDVWAERVRLLAPYQVNADAARGDRQPEGQVHALPARVPRREHDGRRARSPKRPA